MRFKKAILKTPSKAMINGLTSQNFGTPDYNLACKQHNLYKRALEKAGVKTIVLNPDENYPDSCFVEDTAILTEEFAIITNPGADSRKGEIFDIKSKLSEFYKTIYSITPPGTLDGGDVLRVENGFFIGISARTNIEGGEQLKAILEKNGYKAFFVKLDKYLHLKTGVAYLGNNTVVLAGELKNNQAFKDFNKIIVDDKEEYAANCIKVNDFVLLAKGFPKIKQDINNLGHIILELDMSEFRKIDGGLSCLSLRF
jgi:dimethylargininase